MGLRPTQGNEKPLAPFSTFVIPSGGDASFASPESRDLHFPRLGQSRCLFFDRAESKRQRLRRLFLLSRADFNPRGICFLLTSDKTEFSLISHFLLELVS